MSLVRRDLRVGDDLDSFEQRGCLSHRNDQVRSYTGSDALVLWGIGKSVQVCHGDGHVSARRLVDWLIPDHVESITEVVWRKLPLFIHAPPSTIGIALLAELLLLVDFAIDNWFVIADVKDKISSPGWKDRETRKTRRVWR